MYSLSKINGETSSFHPSTNLVPNLDLHQEESPGLQVEGKGFLKYSSFLCMMCVLQIMPITVYMSETLKRVILSCFIANDNRANININNETIIKLGIIISSKMQGFEHVFCVSKPTNLTHFFFQYTS